MDSKSSFMYKSETHLILYVLLLITTPFLLLQNYLQSAIGQLSNLTYNAVNISIPVTVTIAIILIIVLLFFTFKKLNKRRIISWVIVVILFWIGQKTTDFYFNHKYYELQYNWHYFAYAIFSYLTYRMLSGKNIPAQRIIIITFFSALAISTFDELVQMPLSNRIFDLGDISKDLWGSMIGLFVIYFILEDGKIITEGWRIRHEKLNAYFRSPVSMLLFGFIFAYVFMVVTSLLTSTDYIFSAIFISIVLFAIVFLIIHLSQFKPYRILIIGIFTIAVLIQGYFIIKYSDKGIIYCENKLLVYKGIPIYYFDVLIYPNGLFRLVDKKKDFNKRDQQTIEDLSEFIVIIGSGSDGMGGNGFPKKTITQFVFNYTSNTGTQIVVLKNKTACDYFNLIRKDKKPVFIIHNN